MTAPKGAYTYKLDPHPTFTADELRLHLGNLLRKELGPEAGRLKSVDVAQFVPANMVDQVEIERRGLPDGPMYQVVAFLAHAGNDQKGKAMRTVIPARIRWDDIWKLSGQIAMTMKNMITVMRREERGSSAEVASFAELGGARA